jgi:hypothetical protein
MTAIVVRGARASPIVRTSGAAVCNGVSRGTRPPATTSVLPSLEPPVLLDPPV